MRKGRVPRPNLLPETGGYKLEAAWKEPWGRPPRSGCEEQSGGTVISAKAHRPLVIGLDTALNRGQRPVKKGGTAEPSVLFRMEGFFS